MKYMWLAFFQRVYASHIYLLISQRWCVHMYHLASYDLLQRYAIVYPVYWIYHNNEQTRWRTLDIQVEGMTYFEIIMPCYRDRSLDKWNSNHSGILSWESGIVVVDQISLDMNKKLWTKTFCCLPGIHTHKTTVLTISPGLLLTL